MKTVGERIRQARLERGMSGATLAKIVGYKNQSAIGNLENRTGADGGNKIKDIAAALDVTVDWLLRGPDTDAVPFRSTYPKSADTALLQRQVKEAEADWHVTPTSAPIPIRSQPQLIEILIELGSLLAAHDESARRATASLLADIAVHPENSLVTSQRICALLGVPGNDQLRKSTGFGVK